MKRLLFIPALVLVSHLAVAGETVVTKEEGIDAAKLWAHTCQQCHNLQPASKYSDSQWDVIVHHMRVRANLTGPEQRAIVQFLKEAN
jgi:hypothetical protein